MHQCVTKSNLLILHPQNKDKPAIRTNGWYVLYPPNSAEPLPVYVLDPTDYSDYTYQPPVLPCADMTNQRVTGKCKLVYAFIEEDPTSYQKQTIDPGSGENIIAANGRVTSPYAQPYSYSEQQTYGFVKYHDYFDPQSLLNQSDYTHLVLLTARQIPSPRVPLKVFGTPITLTYRVVQLSELAIETALVAGSILPPPVPNEPFASFHYWTYIGAAGSRFSIDLPVGFFGEFILPPSLSVRVQNSQVELTAISDASLGELFKIYYEKPSYTRFNTV